MCASRINLKKNQGLQALPALQPSSQVCSTHILHLGWGAWGGSACPQRCSAGIRDLLLPCGLTSTFALWTERESRISDLGKCQCEFSASWKESVPNSSVRNASILFQYSIILQNYEVVTDQVSVLAFTKSLSQSSHAYWKSSFWPTGSWSVQSW